MPGAATFAVGGAAKPKADPKPSSDLPPVGGLPSLGGGRKPFGLGGVHGRAGAFDYDQNLLNQAKALDELNRINEPGIGGVEEEKKEEDGRSMLEVMQAKRKQ